MWISFFQKYITYEKQGLKQYEENVYLVILLLLLNGTFLSHCYY